MIQASLGKHIRLIPNMFYVNLSYIQTREFVDFNNTVYTKEYSTVIWLKN